MHHAIYVLSQSTELLQCKTYNIKDGAAKWLPEEIYVL